jgi:hypothetical protein
MYAPNKRRIAVLVTEEQLERIDRLVAVYEARLPGSTSSRSEVVRGVISKGLAPMERLLGIALDAPPREKRRKPRRDRKPVRNPRPGQSS